MTPDHQTLAKKPMNVPFNRPFQTGDEVTNLTEASQGPWMSGGGAFFKRCQEWMESHLQVTSPVFTHSCTHALEMASLLAEVQLGDEVIMPSFTFSSTANAFALRGATPVFVDIRQDTLNLDEQLIEDAITPKTRAIVPVHYAGVSCEMDAISRIAGEHKLMVIEDAAHAFLASYKGKMLGTLGTFGTFSFHETKGIHCGEGGVIVANDPSFHDRLAIIAEKGTNRAQFLKGQVDKYSWVDIGSSYLPSELSMAFLYAQFQQALTATELRLSVWNQYHQAFEELESTGVIRRPIVPEEVSHNAHLYYLLLPTEGLRDQLLSKLRAMGVGATFHYIPLHSSVAGRRYGRVDGSLKQTDSLSKRLIRLPLWLGMNQQEVDHVIESVTAVLSSMTLLTEA